MNELYPLKFSPQYKETIWGGSKLNEYLNKDVDKNVKCGESWEISAVQDSISVVSNGFLAGNNLQELIEVYLGDLVGEKVYHKFGAEFPLLVKFIDANDKLSLQVHPNDELAGKRHKAYGKTEMWYVVQSDEDAELIVGFNQKISKQQYLDSFKSKSLPKILNFEKVKAGDVYFIPAGSIHAIGKGILVAEIQQTSDITYRIYDWERLDKQGNPRELHTDLAIDAIDYSYEKTYKSSYEIEPNKSCNMVDCDYFTTNIFNFDHDIEIDYTLLDSFVAYMCLEGSFSIKYSSDKTERVEKGETVLIPAALKNLVLETSVKTKVIEMFIK